MANTVLVLKAQETLGLVSMSEAIHLMETAYRDYGHNMAQIIPRRRIEVPLQQREQPAWFWLNVIPGAVPAHNAAAAAVRVAGRHYVYPSEGGRQVASGKAKVLVVNSTRRSREPAPNSPDAFAVFMKADHERAAAVAKAFNVPRQ